MKENTSQPDIHDTKPTCRTNGTPDVETMKKFIFTELPGINEEDLDVMEYSEILTFYYQLKGATPQAEAPLQVNTQQGELRKEEINKQTDKQNIAASELQTSINDSNERARKNGQVPSASIRNQIADNKERPQTQVSINGIFYFKPNTLSQNSYQLDNKRFGIICRSNMARKQRRAAVIQCYNSSMAESIKLMNDQEIDQIYTRLRTHNLKQGQLNIKYWLNGQLKPKPICIQINKQQLPQKTIFYGQDIEQYSVKPASKSQKSKDNIEDQNIQNEQIQQNQNIIEDEFFDQLFVGQPSPTEKVQTQEIEKKEVAKVQPSLRQTLRSLKQKQKIQSSVQTQKLQNRQIRTKSKITILSQTEYIQQNDDESEQYESRPRPSDLNGQNVMPMAYKIKNSKFQQQVVNPGVSPSPEVLQWIKNMKDTLDKFEYEYLDQFRTNWVPND